MTSFSASRAVDATITILELRGVKCQSKRDNSVTRSIKRLSNKYGEYANVNDNAETILSEPNVKAIISWRHTSDSSDGSSRLEQLTSLPMGEESRDVHNKSVIMSGIWPTDDKSTNSFQLSTEIQQVQIPDGANGITEMSIPASVSLQVGLMVDGSETVQSLGVATILISGNDQTIELCIPVEAEKRVQKFSPKNFIRKEFGSNPIFGVTPWAMLKIKLNVVADQYCVNAIRASSSIEASSIASAVIGREPQLKSRLELLGTQTKSQAMMKSNDKTQFSSLKVNAKVQSTFLRAKALVALAAKRAGVSQINAASEHNLPELTVITPSSDVSTSRSLHGATEIILKSTIPCNTASATDLVDRDICKLKSTVSESFDVSTANDEDSSVTRTTTVGSKSFDADSTECSIVTEQDKSVTKSTGSKSRITQGTNSSSDKSSCESFADIVITASRVTFEESMADASSPQSPMRVNPAESKELFAEDVTTQLDEIVRVYSMRANAETKISNNDAQMSDTDIAEKNTNDTPVKQEAEPTMFADIILNAFSADTARPDEAKAVAVLDEIKEKPNDTQSVVLVHEDGSGARFDVEVSVDGDLSNIETGSQVEKNTIQNEFDDHYSNAQQSRIHMIQEGLPQHSFQTFAGSTVTPVKSFEQSYITLKHTMSSIGDLTVDSALDSITVPSVISRSIKVAKNKRHPQRREATDFLRRVTFCGSKYDLAEVMDDAVVGWKDIVVGDELCDGFDYASDDESAASLNTMDEATSRSNCLGANFCRGG